VRRLAAIAKTMNTLLFTGHLQIRADYGRKCVTGHLVFFERARGPVFGI
jgi:hypothetical protein